MTERKRNVEIIKTFASGQVSHISCVLDRSEHHLCRMYLLRRNKTIVEVIRKLVKKYAELELKETGGA